MHLSILLNTFLILIFTTHNLKATSDIYCNPSLTTQDQSVCSTFDSCTIPQDTDLKIGFWSSWKKKCGIAIYTKHLYDALKRAGYTVFAYTNSLNFAQLAKRVKLDKIDVLNIQYESVLWHCPSCITRDIWINGKPDRAEFIKGLRDLKKTGVKIIITFHSEPEYVTDLAKVADQLIYHRPSLYLAKNKKTNVIPMAVPLFTPSKTKPSTRQKYGFSNEDIILSTVGFMFESKQHADILERLVPWLKSNHLHHIQLIAPFNDSDPDKCQLELEKIEAVIGKYDLKDQVVLLTSFIPQQELSERLWISDLGYLWCDLTTTSSSAASKEFIAARLPLVTTDSSHYHDLTAGVIKIAKDKVEFVNTITSIVNTPQLQILQNEMNHLYEELNYDVIIQQYIAIFQK